jgi:hypothetical protein
MRSRWFIGSAVLWSSVVSLTAAAGAQGTALDFQRSETVNQRLAGLTVNVAEAPTWIGPTRFWYRKSV